MADLHERLAEDTKAIGETAQVWLRWMNDQRFPWVVIVPKIEGVTEWYQLSEEQQQYLLKVVNRCAKHLQRLTGADKINIGSLGNLVPQLHVHVVARFVDDVAWPGAVWGQGPALPWADGEQPSWLGPLRERLSHYDKEA